MAVRRERERVTPLELFFDLVFVLAITQCTALMAHDPTWRGIFEGMVVLGLLWWAWVGYAWLTSVVDPEEGGVRLAIFAAMASFLVLSLCIPLAFDDLGLTFAVAYALVRYAQIALFLLASRDDPTLRHSVVGLLMSTTVGAGLVIAGALFDGGTRDAVWALALVLDMGGPLVIDPSGWQLHAEHFAERHGLIVLIALGESIVAIGVGAEAGVDAGVIVAAVLGMTLAAGLWWAYFDVVSTFSARNLERQEAGRPQNTLARDCYSYLHFPMVAGIVLGALGLKTTLAHVHDPLSWETGAALFGGVALYLLAHVGFAWRDHRTLKSARLLTALVLLVLVPATHEVEAIVVLGIVAAVVALMIAWETVRFAEQRDQIRHAHPEPVTEG